MPADTEWAAVDAYIQPLQVAISCISKALLGNFGGHYISERPHILTLPTGPIQLHREDHGQDLSFDMVQQYQIVPWEGRFRVHTLHYSYEVDDFDTEKEILAYHWHPGPNEQVKHPHLHVSDGAQIGRKELLKAHFPTGRVALEDVIQFLIEFFHVETKRPDWAEKLEHSRQKFRTYRTWA